MQWFLRKCDLKQNVDSARTDKKLKMVWAKTFKLCFKENSAVEIVHEKVVHVHKIHTYNSIL